MADPVLGLREALTACLPHLEDAVSALLDRRNACSSISPRWREYQRRIEAVTTTWRAAQAALAAHDAATTHYVHVSCNGGIPVTSPSCCATCRGLGLVDDHPCPNCIAGHNLRSLEPT